MHTFNPSTWSLRPKHKFGSLAGRKKKSEKGFSGVCLETGHTAASGDTSEDLSLPGENYEEGYPTDGVRKGYGKEFVSRAVWSMGQRIPDREQASQFKSHSTWRKHA